MHPVADSAGSLFPNGLVPPKAFRRVKPALALPGWIGFHRFHRLALTKFRLSSITCLQVEPYTLAF
jgi:hypothetical protein